MSRIDKLFVAGFVFVGVPMLILAIWLGSSKVDAQARPSDERQESIDQIKQQYVRRNRKARLRCYAAGSVVAEYYIAESDVVLTEGRIWFVGPLIEPAMMTNLPCIVTYQ